MQLDAEGVILMPFIERVCLSLKHHGQGWPGVSESVPLGLSPCPNLNHKHLLPLLSNSYLSHRFISSPLLFLCSLFPLLSFSPLFFFGSFPFFCVLESQGAEAAQDESRASVLLCHLLPVCSWEGHSVSPSLSFKNRK